MNSNDTTVPATAAYTTEQREKFELLLQQKGIVPVTFQLRLECGILADLLDPRADLTKRLAVRAALGLGPLPSEPGSHIVDYSQALEVMVAAGNYDWTNDGITPKCFPIVGEGKVEFEDALFHFDKDVSSAAAIAQICAADPANPWEPAKIENILAYGAKNPEEQRKFPIIALGSVAEVRGGRRVPYLGGDGSVRSLDLGWFDGGWGANDRFLAVRKKSRTSVS
ncbi:MAG: hypothetical protein AAB391_03310 [Patescibacteria group bacterium]